MPDFVGAALTALIAYITARWLITTTGWCRWIAWAAVWWHLGFAVRDLATGRVSLAAGHAAAAAVYAHWLWRNRPRKDRRPSRVTGMVRDLGHRLIVAPVPAESR